MNRAIPTPWMAVHELLTRARMRHAATLERLGFAASVVGLLSLFAALASLAIAGSETPPQESRPVEAATERLRHAIAARRDGRRDDQFDAIVGSLVAGLGADTPRELGPALEMIRGGRAREIAAGGTRATTRSSERATDPDVETGLAAAHRALGRVEATATSEARDASHVVASALLVGTVAVALGIGMLAAATRLRSRERRAICAIFGLSPPAAHSGRLAVEIGRTVAIGAAPRSVAPRAEPVTKPGVKPAGRAERARPIASASGDVLFGRILEITAIEE